jgi:hypothetical protein
VRPMPMLVSTPFGRAAHATVGLPVTGLKAAVGGLATSGSTIASAGPNESAPAGRTAALAWPVSTGPTERAQVTIAAPSARTARPPTAPNGAISVARAKRPTRSLVAVVTGKERSAERASAHLRARGNDQDRIAAQNQAVPDRSIGYTKPPGTTAWAPNTDTLPYRGTSAGGGYSTVEDLARFAHALLGHKLLSPDSTKLLITGKVKAGPGTRYAYGFEDARDADGNGWVGHGGGAPGMNGDLRIYPKSGYAIVVLANIDPPAAQRISEYLEPRLPTKG